MANHMKAVAELCPSVLHNRRVGLEEVADYISGKCGMAASDVRHVLEEIRNSLLYFCATGATVKVDGIGLIDGVLLVKCGFHCSVRCYVNCVNFLVISKLLHSCSE